MSALLIQEYGKKKGNILVQEVAVIQQQVSFGMEWFIKNQADSGEIYDTDQLADPAEYIKYVGVSYNQWLVANNKAKFDARQEYGDKKEEAYRQRLAFQEYLIAKKNEEQNLDGVSPYFGQQQIN